ncbi:MAG: Creatinine amidohydrolase [Verrucomicrobiae bacterium]|nr:Creatinine amidohydrolase [Verrucomicrobiae bacterium]
MPVSLPRIVGISKTGLVGGKLTGNNAAMIDGTRTTFDWQANSTDIAVMGYGSFEQHSAHLPLLTDCIQAGYFARQVAEALGAGLLPTMDYGTCLEHSAFRGSISLRPETVMQIVRDLAAQLERQNFRFFVLINGHGGNFSLQPPARDINAQNRPLKIILANWWEFGDPALSVVNEVHAGAWETSVMLALRPDLVGADRRDLTVESGLQQRDLTMFGVGHFNVSGAIGQPSKASAEMGREIVASVRQNLIAYVRDRIDRLRQNPKY